METHANDPEKKAQGGIDNAKSFHDSKSENLPNQSKAMEIRSKALKELRALSINNELDKMRESAKEATFIAGRMALTGQFTVFFAGPNTGKTLLTLKLVSEAIANGTAGDHVYHINLDDNFDGLIEKGDIGNRHGFQVISSAKFPSPAMNFAELIDFLLKEGIAAETVFIMDTIKKFFDVMNKKASSDFMNTCRKLTSAGGSIIALAHINKNKGEGNKGIPAGTSDVLDDCDCAYVINIVKEERVQHGIERTVEFEQKKSRGPVVQSAVYSYIVYEDSDYDRTFNSVKLIDGNEADQMRAKRALECELERDRDLIIEVSTLLSASGDMIQKDLMNALSTSSPSSRRRVTDCLRRWSCPPGEGGLWTMTKGPHNSSMYKLNQ